MKSSPAPLRSPAAAARSEVAARRLETRLMARFRDTGAEAWFVRLYEVAHADLERWIGSCLSRRGVGLDPSEILQDTFVAIFRYAGSFRDERPGSFRVWSRTIALNLVRQARRERWRPSLQDLPEGLQEPADRSCEPGARAQLREERGLVARSYSLYLLLYLAAWRELSERDRRALQLVEVEGISYAEGCRLLGVGMSNMKMIMFRARKRIRDRLQGSLDELRAARVAAAN